LVIIGSILALSVFTAIIGFWLTSFFFLINFFVVFSCGSALALALALATASLVSCISTIGSLVLPIVARIV
jgi:hypothetical protein